jgi:dTDP-4-amino-4,6-dideoxygalactose transaminase
VFVEVDAKTFCIDPEAIKKAITPKTKAIVPVHLYGHVCQMEEIMAIANEHQLYVIEDNAQAIGADYFFANGSKKKTGSIGTIGATSFFPSKNLGCYGDGGAIFTNDDALANRLKMVANHGQSKRYYHEVVGCNSRLDTVQAAVLNVKLRKLDAYITARRSVADYYDKAFAHNNKITTPFRAAYGTHVFHQYTLLLEGVDRDGLNQYLADKQIPSMIYYPVPAHRQQMFAAFGGANYKLATTDWLTERVISLPIHTEMETDQLEYITKNVLDYIN